MVRLQRAPFHLISVMTLVAGWVSYDISIFSKLLASEPKKLSIGEAEIVRLSSRSRLSIGEVAGDPAPLLKHNPKCFPPPVQDGESLGHDIMLFP